ncbi:MAG: 5'-nucleotidase C-terminal domain-containing protein [Gammaproteobacteria bacterium]|nr:5'-nucleotidase C-terminal domain-containing protein [Gammaproteobacteria bacterium]
MRKLAFAALFITLGGIGCAPTPTAPEPDTVVISVVGTNDVHGELIPQPFRGGITTFSAYIAALRDARANDGAVLLVDAGDMWQGTLESNLSEGAAVVGAYNALGYAAAAIGNHEFDFGPAGPKSIPEAERDEPQGALRQRASEADFPLLAANLIDTSTDEMVIWDNVQALTMVRRAGIDIGIIGVLTERLLETTIVANTAGIDVAPIADSVTARARFLRKAGAALVVVVAHAGGRCEIFDDPLDLSSCDLSGEIMRVANEIPQGLVDHIVAGHVHQGIAHEVNGIAITASYSNSRAFSRVDFTLDRTTRRVVDRRIFPPQANCRKVPDKNGHCSFEDDSTRARATYEGRDLVPMPEVVAVAENAAAVAAKFQAEPIGVYLETPMTLHDRPESALGNLMTDAVLESSAADISIHNVYGGIRAELPEGELTYGSLFRMFPFDNRIAIVELSGAELRKLIANQAHNTGRYAGFSGMRVFIDCSDAQMSVRMVRSNGSEISDTESLKVVANDFLLLGGDGIFTPVIPPRGFDIPYGTPLVRDVLVEWFKTRGGRMHADEFHNPASQRWNLPEPMPGACSYSAE